MPADLVSFASDPALGDWTPVRHGSTFARNIWVPTSLYWKARTRINLPYLPYFSNCKGYGSTIPFWALMEQHYVCELVANEDTFWMGAFSFGLAPEADGCEDVIIQCTYDEIFMSQSPLPRWYEVEGETPLFELSTEPVDYFDLMQKDFNAIEVLAVAPAEGVGEENSVPKEVAFGVSYYQWNRDAKRLIGVQMEYGNVEAITEKE